jgi:hypothetical protein
MSFRGLLKWPETCTNEASRDGELEPCGKPAVAAAWDEENDPYPVCKYHAHRARELVTLEQILLATLGGIE